MNQSLLAEITKRAIMKSLKNVQVSTVNKSELQSINGGSVLGFWANPPLPGAIPTLHQEDDCPYTNPDGTFNKDSGWCGSGPGGQGIFPV